MPDSKDPVECILSKAAGKVDLIVLFGSQARGDHGPESDIDIAVSVPGATPAERFEMRLEFIGLLAKPERIFDVVMIEDVSWSLRFRIARDGRVLYERKEGLWSKFVEDVITYYPDWRIFEERFLEDYLSGV